jgi:coenzyme F420 hydrogenase subunit beta
LKKLKTFKDLIKEVHEKGICQQCGGCVSFCNSIENNVIGFKTLYSPPTYLNKDKCLQCGLCYLICPQTHILDDEINKVFKFTDFFKMPIGFLYNIYSCQAIDKDFLNCGTDGGVVNSLLNYLLEEGLIDGAIVAKTTAPFAREVTLAENKNDLIQSSGIKLDVYPQLEEIQKYHTYVNSLPKLKQYRSKRLAVVGTPCQIYTIRCMQNLGIAPSENIEYCFGLFCYENFFFNQSQAKKFEKNFNVRFEDLEKINIKEDLILYINDRNSEKRILHIPFNQLNKYMRPACKACSDLTNIYADISFGGLGSSEGFTTVFARTDKGRKIILKAIKAQIIKCKHLNLTSKEIIKKRITEYSISKVKRKKDFLKKLV